MEPTIHCGLPKSFCEGNEDDRVIVREVSASTLRRGDIVAFHPPRGAATACGASGTFVNRVVGMPGEVIVGHRDGVLWVDGHRLVEPYLHRRGRRNSLFVGSRWRVPQRSLFLVGDNRTASCDSRIFGAVSFGDMIGRVTTIEREGRPIPVP
jgi:signal peptidase I